jgi:acyl-CoA hydrolase
VIAYADGADSPCIDPWVVAELTGLEAPPAVLLGWMPSPPDWTRAESLRGVTIMAGYGLANAISAGRIRYLPVRLSSVPRLISDVIRPAVAVVAGVRRGGRFAYRGTVGWAPAAVAAAKTVVVELEDGSPDLGAPLIEGPIDHVHESASSARPVPTVRRPDDVDLAIGGTVVSLLPKDSTIQVGPGGIGEAVLASLTAPVGIRSGLLTESMAELGDRGLLLDRAHAGYVWGGRAITHLAMEDRLGLHPVEVTHDVSTIASIPRFVSCNTALQVGIDGAVNVERVGGRLVAGIGGHADFCAGASRSPGGLSIVALRSTTRNGASTIVPAVEVVSTPRCDVDLVVTEHGTADLRGCNDSERARRMVEIAAPEQHEDLKSQARRNAR